MMAVAFGQKVKKRREERGLSQVELAKLAGVHQYAISKWEQGQRAPNLTSVLLLAKALRISASRLVAGLPAPRLRVNSAARTKTRIEKRKAK